MKITKQRLRQLIKEELSDVLNDARYRSRGRDDDLYLDDPGSDPQARVVRDARSNNPEINEFLASISFNEDENMVKEGDVERIFGKFGLTPEQKMRRGLLSIAATVAEMHKLTSGDQAGKDIENSKLVAEYKKLFVDGTSVIGVDKDMALLAKLLKIEPVPSNIEGKTVKVGLNKITPAVPKKGDFTGRQEPKNFNIQEQIKVKLK